VCVLCLDARTRSQHIKGEYPTVRISIWLKAELAVLLRRVLKRNTARCSRRTRRRHAPSDGDALSGLRQGRHHVESHDLPHDAIVGELIAALAQSPCCGEPSVGGVSRRGALRVPLSPGERREA